MQKTSSTSQYLKDIMGLENAKNDYYEYPESETEGQLRLNQDPDNILLHLTGEDVRWTQDQAEFLFNTSFDTINMRCSMYIKEESYVKLKDFFNQIIEQTLHIRFKLMLDQNFDNGIDNINQKNTETNISTFKYIQENCVIGKQFLIFIVHRMNVLKSVLLLIKNLDEAAVEHKLENCSNQFKLFLKFQDPIINSRQKLFQHKDFKNWKKFMKVYDYGYKDNIIKRQKLTWSQLGLLIKGKSWNEKLGFQFGELSNYGMNFASIKKNQRQLKRIIHKEKYGKLLLGVLRMADLYKLPIKLKFDSFYSKYIFNTDHNIKTNFENFFEENCVENDIKIKLLSLIDHANLLKHRDKISDKSDNTYSLSSLSSKTNFQPDTSSQINKLKEKGKLAKDQDIDTLILFVHGGGFIGGGNELHRQQTNQMACKCPLISIDQRVAPEYPYPASLNDIFRLYYWITSGQVCDILGQQPRDIILSGDSAGGNMVLVLLNHLIKTNAHKHIKGLALLWPNVKINAFDVNQGQLLLLKDKLLNFRALEQMARSFLNIDICKKDDVYLNDIHISPTNVSDEILAQQPKTWIIAGSKDYMTLESIELAERMFNLGIDVKQDLVNELGHAFIQFNVLVPECRNLVKNVINAMNWFQANGVQIQIDDEIDLIDLNGNDDGKQL